MQNLCEVLGRVFQNPISFDSSKETGASSWKNERRTVSKPISFCSAKKKRVLHPKEKGGREGEKGTPLRVSFHSPPLRLTPSGAKEPPKGAVSRYAHAPCRETTALPQKRSAPGVIPKRGDGPSLAVKGGLGVNRKTPSRLFFGDPKPHFF